MVYIIMKKLIILVILISFFTGCSNLVGREEITLKEKENLVLLIENIKYSLQQGDVTLLEKTLTYLTRKRPSLILSAK